MLRSTTSLITLTSLRSYSRPCLLVPRFYSTPSPWKRAATPVSPHLVQDNFPRHFVHVLDVGWRFFKFSIVGLTILGATIGVAYEGTHLWVEKNELAPESDQDLKRWQWESDADRWTGDPLNGGTDPGLGFKTRHLVRAAWMAYTWGIGHNTTAIGTHDQRGSGLLGPAGIKVINPQLQLTDHFLRVAIHLAERSQDTLRPNTFSHLLTLHGNILEKLGTDFLPEAMSEFKRAWSCLHVQDIDSARIALKLGDINSQLGCDEHAIEWWTRALQLINNKSFQNNNSEPLELVPKLPPPSPLAQRLLSSTLVSLSAFYAKSGQYQKAEAIQDSALKVIRAIRQPDSLPSASPPQALHALYLLQRSSILSVHLAEVLYAQQRPAISSLQWLTFAAESSERVARVLTGLPLPKSEEFHLKQSLPHPLEEHLLISYSSSRSMNSVAKGLLRDARRTAAEAWNLMGMLHEAREGKNSKSAAECFERAIEWASTSSHLDGKREAAEGVPGTDWKIFWTNYQRTNRQVEQHQVIDMRLS